MLGLSSFVRLVGVVLAALLLGACGASLVRQRRAEAYFERCFAADRDAHVSHADRRRCWQAWHEHYAEGQPSERVEHARERILLLDPTHGEAVSLATGESEEEQTLVATLDVPPPTASSIVGGAEVVGPPAAEVPVVAVVTESTGSPSSEPVAVASSSELWPSSSDTPRRPRPPIAPRMVTGGCASSCAPTYGTCMTHCTPRDRACRDACRLAYRQCGRGCW